VERRLLSGCDGGFRSEHAGVSDGQQSGSVSDSRFGLLSGTTREGGDVVFH